MPRIALAGRILFVLPFLAFGLHHLVAAPSIALLLPKGFPAAIPLVYVSGIFLVLAALSMASGFMGKPFSLLLAAYIMLVLLTVHVPQLFSPNPDPMLMISLLKDVGLMGGALTYAVIFDRS